MTSSASELTDAELRELRDRLRAAADDLRRSLTTLDDAAQVVELDQPTMGRLSRVDAIQNQQMARANRQSAQMRLRQIDAALERMADHEYGDCARCDDPIGVARLRVRPEAVLCVACQERQEGR